MHAQFAPRAEKQRKASDPLVIASILEHASILGRILMKKRKEMSAPENEESHGHGEHGKEHAHGDHGKEALGRCVSVCLSVCLSVCVSVSRSARTSYEARYDVACSKEYQRFHQSAG